MHGTQGTAYWRCPAGKKSFLWCMCVCGGGGGGVRVCVCGGGGGGGACVLHRLTSSCCGFFGMDVSTPSAPWWSVGRPPGRSMLLSAHTLAYVYVCVGGGFLLCDPVCPYPIMIARAVLPLRVYPTHAHTQRAAYHTLLEFPRQHNLA